MGQYYKGQKIGTCECMYYMRLETAQELAKQGERDEDGISFEEYLKDNQTKWRFPFPDEDEGIKADCKYNKSFVVLAGDIEVDHDRICIGNTIDGVDNVNIFLPCPYSKEFRDMGIKTSMGGPGQQKLLVVMEGIRDEDGKRVVKTIFECARCHQMQRFSKDDVIKIKQATQSYYEVYKPIEGANGKDISGNRGLYEYAQKVIERIH